MSQLSVDLVLHAGRNLHPILPAPIPHLQTITGHCFRLPAMEDDDFYRRLQAFTGDQEAWEGFDPSGWRSIMEAGENDGMDALEQAISATDEAQVPQDDMVWASDDSAEMIFNVHKLTAKERTQSRVSKRNKARAVAASKPRYVPDLKELEQVKWAESGLAVGDVSPEGVRFVPWKLVESYPDMFIGKRNSVRVGGPSPGQLRVRAEEDADWFSRPLPCFRRRLFTRTESGICRLSCLIAHVWFPR